MKNINKINILLIFFQIKRDFFVYPLVPILNDSFRF
jgi:hypothetical protein